jgi:hypothetical protein
MLPIIKPSAPVKNQQPPRELTPGQLHSSTGAEMDDSTDLKFATFTSEIELPFYSNLFSSKLEHDKLDDSMRPVLGLYEPRVGVDATSSTKMQIRGNALTYST